MSTRRFLPARIGGLLSHIEGGGRKPSVLVWFTHGVSKFPFAPTHTPPGRSASQEDVPLNLHVFSECVNRDTHRHCAGRLPFGARQRGARDEAQRGVAAAFRELPVLRGKTVKRVRSIDVAAGRLGGEEFAFLIGGRLDDAVEHAEC